MRHNAVLNLTVGIAVALTACGDGTTTDPTPTATTAPDDGTAAPTDPVATETTEPTDQPTTDELPGESWEGPPLNGQPATLAVIGVAADDTLNVRAAPGVDQPLVATLAPLANDVAATGRARQLPASIWLEVTVDGELGWVASPFLGFLGSTDDVTSQVVADAGRYPNAETMLDLGLEVAALFASQDPPSEIVVSAGPSVGDLGEITVDVVGLGDDAVRAQRLVVFATPDDSGEGFTVKSVEATTFCGRGPATGDGACP